jgi:ectoine hydroxylase-related dioxygenase (phytanoyl-CoA dioxygenase family)
VVPDTSFDQIRTTQQRELSQVLDCAEAFVAAGNFRLAIDIATAANHSLHAPELERRIMHWRANAFPTMDAKNAPSSWPQSFADPFPGIRGVPEIEFAKLSVEIIGGAFQHHGSLLVRGLTTREQAADLQAGIDRALKARDQYNTGETAEKIGSWYAETPLDTATGTMRGWGGSLWMADSPRMMYDILKLYEQRGLLGLVSEYLEEPLALSIGKSTLRRMEPGGPPHDWHQDGAFLGKDVRTVNVWLSLSDCGKDAPGLDVVGERLPGVVQTGSHGAAFHWSVGAGLVTDLEQAGTPVVSPVFRPGDALLFDQLMLHRTAVRPEMNKPRYAIESWFFTPSTFPMEQGPIVV